jgi:hypothetical protein
MPATDEVPRAPSPASENLQRTKSRKSGAIPTLRATSFIDQHPSIHPARSPPASRWPRVNGSRLGDPAGADGGVEGIRWDDLGFRIEMPGTPIVDDEKPLPTDHWTRMLDVHVEYEQIFFGLSYTQFKQRRSEEEWFATFVRGLSSVGATITETPVSLDGFRGREIFAELFDVKTTCRTFALRNNAFVSITAGASRDNPSVRRFLDSLMLFRT